MTARRTIALAAALLCAVAAPSRAATSVQMDGQRRTHTTYKAMLSDPAVSTNRIAIDVEPSLDDCSSTSCDVTSVLLTLPRGSNSGRFKATLTMPRELNGSIALLNREGEVVGEADALSSCCGDGAISCCASIPYEWRVSFVVPRLQAGKYTLVVWDRGGAGEFKADVDYRANPPDRKPKS